MLLRHRKDGYLKVINYKEIRLYLLGTLFKILKLLSSYSKSHWKYGTGHLGSQSMSAPAGHKEVEVTCFESVLKDEQHG